MISLASLGGLGSAISGGMSTFLNPIGAFFSKIGSGLNSFFGSNLFGTGYSIGQDIFNIYQQERQNERTMALQERLFERDDNSLTRLMKQYEDNGINPLLAVPNVSQGNTKGFETSAIQSQINYEQERMAREQYKLNKERQTLELDIMRNQDIRAQEEHAKNIEAKGLENSILRARKNGAIAYAKAYGAGYGIEFGDDGYIPPYSQSYQEKLVELGIGMLEKYIQDHGAPQPPKSQLPEEVNNDTDVTVPHPFLAPNTLKYDGKKFEYKPETGTYIYNGKEYKLLQTVKNIIDYEKEEKVNEKFDQYFYDDEFYEPMWKSQ